MNNWWFCIVTEDSDLEGLCFFVQCDTLNEAILTAKENFPGEQFDLDPEPWSDAEAEIEGLDTF